MKKLATLLLSLTAVFALAACGETEDTTPEVTATNPTLAGIDSFVTVTQGEVFDYLAGVTATDEIDGDITSSIEVSGTECLLLDETGLLTTGPLECTLIYTVENSNELSAMKVSTVTVQKAAAVEGEDQIVNGDFTDASQIGVWIKGEFEDGSASVNIVDEVLVVEITGVSWGPASPRIHQEGLEYENGKTYEVSFDAKADEARQMSSQVGVLLSGAPWFTAYGEQAIVDVTTDWQTFTYTFTVIEADTTNGVLTFELGTLNEVAVQTTVYLDNIVVKEVPAD